MPLPLQDLGNINHPSFVARAVYRVVESHKLSNERAVLACMLEVFLQPSEETERSVMKQRQLSLHKGCVICGRRRRGSAAALLNTGRAGCWSAGGGGWATFAGPRCPGLKPEE